MIHVATIGSGMIVDRMIQAIKETEGIQVDAVYSRTEKRAKEFAEKHQIVKSYWNMNEMFQDSDLDMIYIASPNSLHYEQSKKALLANKHVICEKPFCSTVEQAKELFSLAEEKGLYIFEAITNIHTPNYHCIQSELSRCGDIHLVQVNFSQFSSKYNEYKEGKHKNVFDLNFDGGSLMDINVYNLHFVAGLFGKPKKVTYVSNLGYNGIDTSGVVLMEYADKIAICTGAKDCSSPYAAYIQGDQGTIRMDQGSIGVCAHVDFLLPKGDVIGKKNKENSLELGIVQKNHMVYECEDFVSIIQSNDRNEYKKLKEQTLLVMSLLEECKKQRACQK